MIHVIFASDENYAPHLGVHIRSIAETTPGPIAVHVLEKNITAASKEKIKASVQSFDISVEFIKIEFEHEIGKRTPEYINEVAMYRLLMPNLLPSVDKAIYIDVDAVTISSLQPLWDTDLTGKLIALVESPWRKYETYKREIGLSASDPYFNSGTMVVDLKGMRAQNIEKALIDCFLDKRESIEFPDQDVINIVLRGRILSLHPKWSIVRATYDYNGKGTLTYGKAEVAEAKASPAIVQFSGKLKPWHSGCRHPLGYMYNAVRQRTPWALPEEEYGKAVPIRPLVSVVMATRNGEKTIGEAVQSILDQTLSDLEFIIIDDGSTDSTPAMLATYAKNDSRVRILRNETSRGLPSALNVGFNLAVGKYIARMDDDDISEPTRLEEQVSFMNSNPDIHVCGTNVTVIRPFWHEPPEYTPAPPESDRKIKVAMLHRPGMIHPTVMLRGDYVRAKQVRYNPEFLKAQDYELWTRLAFEQSARFHNLQKPLLKYRAKMADPREIRSQQENFAYRVISRNARYLGFTDQAAIDLHARWAAKKFNQQQLAKRYRDIAKHVKSVLWANKQHGLFDQGALEQELLAPYKSDFKDFHKEGSAGIARFEAFPLRSYLRISKEQLEEYKRHAEKKDRMDKLLSSPVIGLLMRLGIALIYPEKVFGKVKI
ncbi:glycosyltransferase [Sinorhizobium medicae]|uniref:glycosyltransferase n=1 Tax=Sinorhizobium medicae TaxID=110321 RepID=UPI000FDBB999|nr:glycosyltransferase [Sinorhizobium medicae]MDX0974737.1 glycosyltransferase [Sinorhizobium medicae]RVP56707.1 glycosyltransferase [Sinorhizobium medicae]RVP75496.1 glycosyltransferase [Sinorhizobium medicae]UWU11066.1 glycosyltransferase [Sinorhizobium medicae]